MTPEARSIAKLREVCAEPDIIDSLAGAFERLHAVEEIVSRSSPTELYESAWALLGLVARSYQLMICSIDQIANKNFNGFYAAVRALMESLCAVVWALDNTDRLPALVQQRPNAGYRNYPQLRAVYSQISAVVHPNRGGHLLTPRSDRSDGARGLFTPFELHFSDWFAEYKLSLLIDVSAKIIDELQSLVEAHPEAIRKGRVMARLHRAAVD